MTTVQYINVTFKAKAPSAKRSRDFTKKVVVPKSWVCMNENQKSHFVKKKILKEADDVGLNFKSILYFETGTPNTGILMGEDIYTYDGQPIL